MIYKLCTLIYLYSQSLSETALSDIMHLLSKATIILWFHNRGIYYGMTDGWK